MDPNNLELQYVIILSILTYIAQFVYSAFCQHLEKRQATFQVQTEHELARLDYQLNEVFGPLRGLLLSTRSCFSVLIARHKFEADVPQFFELIDTLNPRGPSPMQKDWMLWVKHVLQPQNREIATIILEKSMAFDKVPSFIPHILAHIKEFEVILVKWEQGDFTHMNTTLPFDNRIYQYADFEYNRLWERKKKILRVLENNEPSEDLQKLESSKSPYQKSFRLLSEARKSTLRQTAEKVVDYKKWISNARRNISRRKKKAVNPYSDYEDVIDASEGRTDQEPKAEHALGIMESQVSTFVAPS